MASELHARTHAQFPGPIGQKRGAQARMSYIGADGKRHWHAGAMVAVGVRVADRASLTGVALASITGERK